MHTLNELNDKMNNMSFEMQRSTKKRGDYIPKRAHFLSAQNSPNQSMRQSKLVLNQILSSKSPKVFENHISNRNSPKYFSNNASTRAYLHADNFFEQRQSTLDKTNKFKKLVMSQNMRMPEIKSSLNTV